LLPSPKRAPFGANRPAEPDGEDSRHTRRHSGDRTLIGEGININITLLFARSRYEEVVEAFLAGLETLSRNGRLDSIASVCKLLRQPIDSKVDAELEKRART